MQNIKYQILVKDSSGSPVGIVFPVKELKFGKKLNNYGTASFDIAITPVEGVGYILKEDGGYLLKEDGGKFIIDTTSPVSNLIQLRRNYIEIYKQTYTPSAYLLKEDGDFILKEDGGKLILEQSGVQSVKVWAGEQAFLAGNLTPDGNNWMTIKSFTWLEQLAHRFTAQTVTFDDVDQGQIAWGMIETTNSDDDTGITEGSVPATKDRDRTYFNQNIMQAIINLSGVASGFDFDVSDDREFNVYEVKGADKTDSIVLEYGHNISNVRITNDFVNPVNRGIVLGEAVGEDSLQRVERDDAGLQGLYGLREGVMQEMDVSEMATLEDKGDAMITKYGTPLIEIDFELVGNSLSVVDFETGDLIRLRIKEGFFDIDSDYRIFEWEVSADSDGAERVTLLLGNFTL